MNQSQKLLVEDWFRRARESQYIHYASAERYSLLNYWLGIPSTILSAVVGAAVFSSIESEAIGEFKIFLGLISILSAVLTALNTFLGLAELSEKHRAAAANYSSIRKTLERIKTSEESYKVDFDKKMASLQKDFDSLAKNSPNPPRGVSKSVLSRLKSKDHKRVFTIPAR